MAGEYTPPQDESVLLPPREEIEDSKSTGWAGVVHSDNDGGEALDSAPVLVRHASGAIKAALTNNHALKSVGAYCDYVWMIHVQKKNQL